MTPKTFRETISAAEVPADIIAQFEFPQKILIELGWRNNKFDTGFDFDLDAAAFLLGANGKVTGDDDFVFYNNLKHYSGAVEIEDYGEKILIDTAKIPANIKKIAVAVSIYDADKRKQNFGQVKNAFCRAVNAVTRAELFYCDLSEDFSFATAVVVGEIYRHNGLWKFNAIGSGWSCGLAALCRNYGVNV